MRKLAKRVVVGAILMALLMSLSAFSATVPANNHNSLNIWNPMPPPEMPRLAIWNPMPPPEMPRLAIWNPMPPPEMPR